MNLEHGPPRVPRSYTNHLGYQNNGNGNIFVSNVYLTNVRAYSCESSSHSRLSDDSKYQECRDAIWVTDPMADKTRIEKAKGGIIKDICQWILNHKDFVQWREESDHRLRWIQGHPGTGKTMLLCGIIDELSKDTTLVSTGPHLESTYSSISFFFCEATDPLRNSAVSVLRTLIHQLMGQHVLLFEMVRGEYEKCGKKIFEDKNAFVLYSKMFGDFLCRQRGQITLVIDALDECVSGLSELLDFIEQHSSFEHVRWIVSSRTSPPAQQSIAEHQYSTILSLELNKELISDSVSGFVKRKTSDLAKIKKYDERTRQILEEYLVAAAENTFIWVSWACRDLLDSYHSGQDVTSKLKLVPKGLHQLYSLIIQQIDKSEDARVYRKILSILSAVYRPITWKELTYLLPEVGEVLDDDEMQTRILERCGSLLHIRGGFIHFIHQSAKAFLVDHVFDSNMKAIHWEIFLTSVQYNFRNLRGAMRHTNTPLPPAEQLQHSQNDPTGNVSYPWEFYINHLYDAV